jgi:hypothetical protein
MTRSGYAKVCKGEAKKKIRGPSTSLGMTERSAIVRDDAGGATSLGMTD